jgi:hypothetical protein
MEAIVLLDKLKKSLCMKDKLFSMDYESEKTNECFWDI